MVAFVLHTVLHLEPSFVALLGAGVLVAVAKVRSRTRSARVEWPTLAFFMGLFVMVGGLIDTGVIDTIFRGSGRRDRRRTAADLDRSCSAPPGCSRRSSTTSPTSPRWPDRRRPRPRRPPAAPTACGGPSPSAQTSAATPPRWRLSERRHPRHRRPQPPPHQLLEIHQVRPHRRRGDRGARALRLPAVLRGRLGTAGVTLVACRPVRRPARDCQNRPSRPNRGWTTTGWWGSPPVRGSAAGGWVPPRAPRTSRCSLPTDPYRPGRTGASAGPTSGSPSTGRTPSMPRTRHTAGRMRANASRSPAAVASGAPERRSPRSPSSTVSGAAGGQLGPLDLPPPGRRDALAAMVAPGGPLTIALDRDGQALRGRGPGVGGLGVGELDVRGLGVGHGEGEESRAFGRQGRPDPRRHTPERSDA